MVFGGGSIMDPSNVKMREFIYSLIHVKPAMSVLDLGCGTGYDLGRIANRCVDGAKAMEDLSAKWFV